jgi:hypothetical protein
MTFEMPPKSESVYEHVLQYNQAMGILCYYNHLMFFTYSELSARSVLYRWEVTRNIRYRHHAIFQALRWWMGLK